MPTDREAMEYIRRGAERGIPPEQLRETLRKAGFQVRGPGAPFEPPPDIAEPPPSGLPPEVEEMRAAGGRAEQQQMLKEGALLGLGAFGGGIAGEAAGAALIPRVARTAHTIKRLLATAGRIAPEIAGEAAGTYYSGRIAGMSPEEAEGAAKLAAGGGLAGRTIARIGTRFAGRAASLRPETVQAGIEDVRLLRAPESEAELTQARRLRTQLEAQAEDVTPYHRVYQEEFLKPSADRAVDVREYAQILRSKIAGNPNPSSKSADRVLANMANALEGRGNAGIRTSIDLSTTPPSRPGAPDVPVSFPAGEPSGRVIRAGVTPPEMGGEAPTTRLPRAPSVTGVAREAFTPPELEPGALIPSSQIDLPRAGRVSTEISPAITPEEMGGAGPTITLGELDAWIRGTLTDPLHGAYTRGSEQILATRLMEARTEMAERMYERLGRGASSAQKLAAHQIAVREAVEGAFPVGTKAKPSGVGADAIRTIMSDSGTAQKNRTVLAAYDEQFGTRHLENAKRLAMQREWQGKDLETAYAIDSALQPTRPGFVRGVALPVARGGARIARVAGPISAGVTAGTQAERKRKKEKKR